MLVASIFTIRRFAGSAVLFALVLVIIGLDSSSSVDAQTRPTPTFTFAGSTKTCSGPESGSTASVGDVVTCTLTIKVNPTPPDFAIVEVTIARLPSDNNYVFTSAECTSENCVAAATPSSTKFVVVCTPPTADVACGSTLTVTETLTITSLTPDVIRQNVGATLVVATGLRLVPPGSNFFVSQSKGRDANDSGVPNNCQSRTNPCFTITRALAAARDGDTINVLPDVDFFRIAETIRVTKLVTIQPDTGKVVLSATKPIVIFEVTAQGGPGAQNERQRRAIIRNFIIGGCTPLMSGSNGGGSGNGATLAPPVCTTRTSATAAFRLINDSYTEIATNTIGAEDLPIDNGIILANSDHTDIHDNTIQGNSGFVFTPVLTVGQNRTGFGVVTFECLGGAPAGVSDSVRIANNLFTNQWLAGIWLCSDGAGEHEISGNTLRNNYRGIVLKDVTDTSVSTNTLIDGRSDGIILYGASLRNDVASNRVESHIAPAAAGIRVGWVADPIVPLDNLLQRNVLIRDTVGVHVFGARTTQLRENEIKISGNRTAILITPSTFAYDPGTQPIDTEITGNVIVFAGPCASVIGCAIRLNGVTVSVRATDNDWGLRRQLDVEGVLWHAYDDTSLGVIVFTPFRNQAEVTSAPTTIPRPGSTPRPSVSGAFTGPPISTDVTPTITVQPSASATATASPTGRGPASGSGSGSGPMPGAPGTGSGGTATSTATNGTSSTNGTNAVSGTSSGRGGATGSAPLTSLSLNAGCSPLTWPGADDFLVTDAVLGLTPADAQRTVSVWLEVDGVWQGWTADRTGPTEPFLLNRGDRLAVCVRQSATWTIPTRVGDG